MNWILTKEGINVKKLVSLLVILIMTVSFSGCENKHTKVSAILPEESQMRTICKLATMECYYHNVAKYTEEDATGILWWKKDRKFWIEYSGIVTLGVDASLIDLDVNGDTVTIALPPAKVLSCEVDKETLTKDSYIIAKNSAKVSAEHQTIAFKEAQERMKQSASEDTELLNSARERAKQLLNDYVVNIGECVGKTYDIVWIDIDSDNSQQKIEDDEVE